MGTPVRIGFIRIRERNDKLIRLVFVSISITAQKFSKVNLSMSHGVCKRQAA